MKKVQIPASFSTLNRGRVTLYVKKEYEKRMSDQDIEGLFNLCNEPTPRPNHANSSDFKRFLPGENTLQNSFHGKPCNESFVVREYWHGGMIGKVFRDFFWDGMRPVRELSVCDAARRGGIKTTEIIAIVKNRILGPLYKFRLVTKEITKSIDLIELLLHSEANRLLKQKRQIINKLAKAVNDMHDAGIYHADLHLKNILVQSDAGGFVNVYIIDLDKSKQYEKISFQKRMKNIMRLDRSVVKMRRNNKDMFSKVFPFPVSETDRIRFLKKYVGLNNKSVKPLRYYIQSYSKTHALHKLWWSVVGGYL